MGLTLNPDEISAKEISLGKRDKFRWVGSLDGSVYWVNWVDWVDWVE